MKLHCVGCRQWFEQLLNKCVHVFLAWHFTICSDYLSSLFWHHQLHHLLSVCIGNNHQLRAYLFWVDFKSVGTVNSGTESINSTYS